MAKKVIRRAAYGLVAWLFVFALAGLLAVYATEYVWFVLLAAPIAFYWLSLRCLRKKSPHFGSEGLKAGGIWVLVFAVLDLVVMPFISTPYDAFLSARFNYAVYFELLVAPWAADKVMSGLRRI